MEADRVRKQVWALADELNAALGVPLIQPYQQNISAKNISLTGPKRERLYIKLARDGGNSLVARMEPFMDRLTGRERHGYVPRT